MVNKKCDAVIALYCTFMVVLVCILHLSNNNDEQWGLSITWLGRGGKAVVSHSHLYLYGL